MNPLFRIGISLATIAIIAFFGCSNKGSKSQPPLTDKELIHYKQKGAELATSTQQVLASNLVGAIQKGGPVNALEFCNLKAVPLTDSMSTKLQVHIKRVTDQPRNQKNQATNTQLTYIKTAKEKLANQQEIKPSVRYSEGKITAYYPIMTNQLCMQCHGNKNSQIELATLEMINKLYPNDKATGYNIGELRGIWVVEMDKEPEK